MNKQPYLAERRLSQWPRIPLSAFFDLTYRCNLNCRHCWLRLPADDPAKPNELSLSELNDLVDESRTLGCRHLYLSGGEPMLREDFVGIFDSLTARVARYSLNTNGTLITPQIARLMKRTGHKWVALYGADARVCDHITRTPGSFDAAVRGMHLLREAGARFTVQIVLMRDNLHQYRQMVDLATSLSQDWRLGPSWFYLTATRDEIQNRSIREQRLDPREVIALNPPDISTYLDPENKDRCDHRREGEGLFAPCIRARRDFHVDPTGTMSFCSMIKDPRLRYDLRNGGSLREGWEREVPAFSDRLQDRTELPVDCRACPAEPDCQICPVYSWLEAGDYNTRVEGLCEVNRAQVAHKERWQKENCRHFTLGGFKIEVRSDLPFAQEDFLERFAPFRSETEGRDLVISHHFGLPRPAVHQPGTLLHRTPPYFVYRSGNSWVFQGRRSEEETPYQIVVANHDYSRIRIYNEKPEFFLQGRLSALTLMSTDQILLAQFLALHSAMILHSSAVIHRGLGLLFVGHSEAGKSTMAKLLSGQTTLLCDDRNILRLSDGVFRVHGTWSHGEIPMVSNDSAPLKAVYFLHKGMENRIEPADDHFDSVKRLLSCLIRPYCDIDWWQNTLTLLEKLMASVPCYHVFFDRSGSIIQDLLGCSQERATC